MLFKNPSHLKHNTPTGRIASFYYLSHTTVGLFEDGIQDNSSLQDVLKLLTEANEFSELPVRHNEDKLNADLARLVPFQVDTRQLESPHIKAHLLLQAHFSQAALPISDYITDTKTVLDNSIRTIQAMVDISANNGLLFSTIKCMQLLQMICQGRWVHDNTLLQLPNITLEHLAPLKQVGIHGISDFINTDPIIAREQLKKLGFSYKQEAEICRYGFLILFFFFLLFFQPHNNNTTNKHKPQQCCSMLPSN